MPWCTLPPSAARANECSSRLLSVCCFSSSDRDLPAGTSVDSAVAYLNRTGVHYRITDEPRQISGRETGVQTEWPFEGDLIFILYYDDTQHIRFDTVYAEVIGP